jgi:hypothetical protein
LRRNFAALRNEAGMIDRIATVIRRLRSSLDAVQVRHDEAYLSESVSVYDLERRMRELDRNRSAPPYTNAYVSMATGAGR